MKLHWKLVQILLMIGFVAAQENVTLEISDVAFNDIKYAGFYLDSRKTIKIRARGAGFPSHKVRFRSRFDDPGAMFIRTWIIDASSRRPVWELTVDNTEDCDGPEFMRCFNDEIELQGGRYEVYMAAQMPPKFESRHGEFISLKDILRRMLKDDEEDENLYADACRIKIRGLDEVYSAVEVRQFREERRRDAIVSLDGLRDDEHVKESFQLSRPLEVQIYAVGEALDDGEFDYGGITDESTGRKIWEMHDDDSQHAGGALKNRVWRKKLSLDPGRYTVFFNTDDSHSNRGWNANPPFDPNGWGIFVYSRDESFDPKAIKPYVPPERVPLVQISRVGNHANIRKAIEVSKPVWIRVEALGEGSFGEMHDYGWIEDLSSGRRVWEMNYEDTDNGGGASKNRFAETVLRLKKGEYLIRFISDDSHSYNDWNATKPRHAERWGITLFPRDPEDNNDAIKEVEVKRRKPFLALTEVGNDEFIRQDFRIKRAIDVQVEAMGEGTDGTMYDFGWIENADTRKKVWLMEYHDTEHAGGGGKNRIASDIVRLKRGKYTLCYQSDDSHSYNSWNTAQPGDPHKWGISLYAINNKPVLFEKVDEEADTHSDPVLAITRVGDDAYYEKHFKVKQAIKLRVLAMGEGTNGDMFDYGWIEDQRSGQTVWKMKYDQTLPAGGGGKNRLVDTKITLKPGLYVMAYRSDDSHSYQAWNVSAPKNPSLWGITLFVEPNDQQRRRVVELDQADRDQQVLCQLVDVRDDEHVRKTFELDKTKQVRVYAIGEGGWDEMYDYGWIEDSETKEVVWIMQYDETRWGGGARKNRVAEKRLRLSRGEYMLHFITDDSHSPEKWNAAAPNDRENYGITLYLNE